MRNNDVLESSMSDLVGNIAPSVIPANNIAPQPLSEMAYQMGAQGGLPIGFVQGMTLSMSSRFI